VRCLTARRRGDGDVLDALDVLMARCHPRGARRCSDPVWHQTMIAEP